MSSNLVALPYSYWADPTRGRPLSSGKIFIGVVDLDPESFPIDVFYVEEDGTEVPAEQPLDIGPGGIIIYQSKAVQISTKDVTTYSLRVTDKSNNQVYYDPTSKAFTPLSDLDVIALSLNVSGSAVIFSTDTTTPLDNILYIYDAAAEITYAKPAGVVAIGEKIDFTDGNQLTTDLPAVYTMTKVDPANSEEISVAISSHNDDVTAHPLILADISTNTADIATLAAGQQSGVIVFQTFALLDAYTPDPSEESGSFKVVNDPNTALNGYYAWVSGTTYIKDADLALGIVELGNPDAVTGGAVFDWFETVKSYSYGENKAWPDLIQVDKLIDNTGAIISIAGWKMIGIPVIAGEVITFGNFTIDSNAHYAFYNDAALVAYGGLFTSGTLPVTDTVPVGANIMYIDIKAPGNIDADFANLMINEGSALLPYVAPTRFIIAVDDNPLEAIVLSSGNETPTPTTDFNAANKKYTDDNFNSTDDLFDFSINLFDKSLPVTEMFFLDGSGGEVANALTSITGFIKLKPGTDYNYQGAKGAGTFGALYDENKVFIRNTGSVDTGSFTTTSTEVFFRCSVVFSDPALFMIQEGFVVDLLTPYFKVLKAENQVGGWWDDLPEDAEVILLNTGQSNSVGGANKTTYEDSEISENEVVSVWNNGTLSWDNQHLDVTTGVVGWTAFLKEYVTAYGKQFRIVNGGVSGTDIDYHLPGGVGYINFIDYVQNAINEILGRGKRPYIYLIFIQGEADSNDTPDADDYAAKQTTWIAQWKTNLGQQIPIIMGGINEYGIDEPDDITINNSKRRQYADGNISEYYEVTSFATTDLLHRNRAGYIEEAGVIASKIDNIGLGLEITNVLPYTF